MDVYYVDISEVSKEENMFSKYQVYLNELGHEYIFSVFRNNYFNWFNIFLIKDKNNYGEINERENIIYCDECFIL